MGNDINHLNAELNPICHLLALLGGATIVVVSRLRIKMELKEVRWAAETVMIWPRTERSIWLLRTENEVLCSIKCWKFLD